MIEEGKSMDILDEAICFATNAHSGSYRKGTSIPYILHPLEAAAIVGTMTSDKEVIAAAVLHDVVEDTPVSIEMIRAQFGDRIADLVSFESENKREGLPAADTWRIRKEETLTALSATTDACVKMIALGDKLANVRAMERDHSVLGDALWDRFNQKDKEQQYWYYSSISEAVSELSEYPVWREYKATVDRTFGKV
jgi:guanosine-3',5'-bis(diphosphate) 3'-pyrophosphohydrolase